MRDPGLRVTKSVEELKIQKEKDFKTIFSFVFFFPLLFFSSTERVNFSNFFSSNETLFSSGDNPIKEFVTLKETKLVLIVCFFNLYHITIQ